MKLPKIAINNYQFTLVLFILLLFAGLNSYFNMPRTENPSIYVPGAGIVVIYPGASPVDMEQLIALPIEESVNELDDIKKINTSLYDGLAVINVEFTYETDAKEKYDEVVEKINSIRDELPNDLHKLEVNRWTSSDVAIMQLAFVSENTEYSIMEHDAEKLKDEIEKVKGIKRVNIIACPEKLVSVSLRMEKMAQMNISVEDVSNAIASNNANIPGGSIKLSDKSFSVKTSGSYKNLHELENTVVKSYKGRLVYLRDIAEVTYDYEDKNHLAKFNGTRAIFMEVQQKEDFNIFDIMDQVKPIVSKFKNQLNDGISLEVVFDQADDVQNRINGFLGNLGQGILLVGILILLALGVKSALIVIIAIPLSVLIGLSIVDAWGFGMQQISIAGLVVALGLLVDNSIVMVENINRFVDLGYKPRQAAIKGAGQIGWPIVSATATTVLAFVPIVMMPDKAGDFVKSLPFTIIATLTVSLFIALTLNPLITSKVFKSKEDIEKKNQNKGKKNKENLFRKALRKFIEGPYRKTITLALKSNAIIIILALAFLGGAIALFVTSIGISFFPPAEKPQLMIRVNTPEGTNLRKTGKVANYVESVLDTCSEVKHYATNIGHGNPRIYYNIFPRKNAKNFAELFVELHEYDNEDFEAFVKKLRHTFASYPDARIYVKVFEQSPPQKAPVELFIIGDDMDVLKQIAADAESFVKEQEGAINIENQLDVNRIDLYVNINKEKANQLGVPIHTIDKTVRTAVSGIAVSEFRDQRGKEYDIVLRLPEGEDIKVSDFDKIYVTSLAGKQIPLKHLANIEFKEGPGIITRYNLNRNAVITADIREGYTLDDVVEPIRQELKNYDFQSGYDYHFAGEVEGRKESFGGMQRAILIALIAIFAVLVLQFRSFAQPLIIYSAIPLAVIGSILALYITGYTFSFTAFIGLTSLVGIVINNSIILVDYTNKLRHEGKCMDEALRIAGETRFTPIILTTFTTIGGLLPLTLQGGGLWAPMGWTIIGGLLMSTLLTLVVVPVLYRIFSKKLNIR